MQTHGLLTGVVGAMYLHAFSMHTGWQKVYSLGGGISWRMKVELPVLEQRGSSFHVDDIQSMPKFRQAELTAETAYQ